MRWIAAEAALERLKVKPQTLYAYASRGQIAVRPDDHDPRRSLYSAEDIERLSARKSRGRRVASVAESTIRFGEPVLSSAITTIHGGRIYYRGRDAARLAEGASLEAVARLLWQAPDGEDPFADPPRRPPPAVGGDVRVRGFALLARRAAQDPALGDRSEPTLRREAASVLSAFADAVCGQVESGPIHDRLAESWRCEGPRADLIRRTLVLVADHELNASTFAARVAASTGASLAACALAGLATLSGPLHGGMTAEVAAFVAEARRAGDPRGVALKRLAQGLPVPGFGHPLYPDGDPRARAIADAAPWAEDMAAIGRACAAVMGQPPNLDFALVAMARTLDLPPDAPFALFALGRTAGWLAHALEQRAAGALIRPRARYVGPDPEEEPRPDY